MKYSFLLLTLAALLIFPSCDSEEKDFQTRLSSPDGQLQLDFVLSESGQPQYALQRNGQIVIDTSGLGLVFKSAAAANDSFQLESTSMSETRESWTPVWGPTASIDNHYNELVVMLAQNGDRGHRMQLRFRLFDDGLGFRYEFPEQDGLDSVVIMEEQTEFRLTGDHEAWWIPADYDSYEYLFNKSKLSEIDTVGMDYGIADRPDRMIATPHAANTPLTMRTQDGLYLSFHEANLTDYAGMTLAVQEGNTLKSELVPWRNGDKVRTASPFLSPWRTVQIAESPGGLVTSHLILNLNEPNAIADVSWIEPMKYTGVWWELHIGKTDWSLQKIEGSWSDKGGRGHGANTENVMEYIDFNARHGITGLLVEGWNTGWEYWGIDSIGYFSFTTPYPDFDIDTLAAYAKKNGVELIGHHETAGQVTHYESELEEAFAYYRDLGIKAVKTGYAGPILPEREYHHGQMLVEHHRRVMEAGAEYGIMVNAHEPVKQTGLRRTYPNWMAQEGVQGMEYNAWSEGNPPSHTCILPFTRMLAGPIDYTPGIFDLTFNEYRPDNRVYTTLAKQLALYVVIYTPMPMVADLPENYEGHPAFQFIKDVAVDWSETQVLNAEIGEYVTIARREKEGRDWFLGSITNEQARDFRFPLDFLEEGRDYRAIIYKDAAAADWESNPQAYEITSREVQRGDTLQVSLAPGGGQAVHFQAGEGAK
mgnify:CR=1 FL=1